EKDENLPNSDNNEFNNETLKYISEDLGKLFGINQSIISFVKKINISLSLEKIFKEKSVKIISHITHGDTTSNPSKIYELDFSSIYLHKNYEKLLEKLELEKTLKNFIQFINLTLI